MDFFNDLFGKSEMDELKNRTKVNLSKPSPLSLANHCPCRLKKK